MNEWLMIGLGVLLTIGTGFFVASEFSLVNLERNDLETRAERGEKGLGPSIRALRKTSTHLSGAQLGITLTTMLTGFIAEPAITSLLTGPLTDLGIGKETVPAIALTLSLVIATVFSFLIGELIPKTMAITLPLATNKFVIRFQIAFTWITGFLLVFLNGVGNWVVRRFGIEPKEELSSSRTADELSSLVKRSAMMGALDAHTATLLTKTLALSQLTAADVMTPRPRMFTIDREQTVADVVALTNKTGHSRFPVIDGDSDSVIGVAHVKQAAAVPREKRDEVPVGAILVDAIRVPETVGLEALMVELRAKGLQLAIVVDEYGGTAGLVTLEDLVEELVGELADEHDRANVGIIRGVNESIIFPGMTRPDELAEMAIKVPDDGAYETVGGFIMSELGRIPLRGDEVEVTNGTLRVERMDGRRVDRVRFTPDETEVNNV
jgi:CBS domain containing-hemolysin-like protein